MEPPVDFSTQTRDARNAGAAGTLDGSSELIRTRDEEQKKKYEALIENLLGGGYNEHSAEVVLKYAANHLWKD